MIEFKNQIKAEIIADSISGKTKRITTVQLTYPRFILAQLNTHRVFSRSTASSRAIPTKKLLETVRKNPIYPVHWGKNQAGMVAEQQIQDIGKAKKIWQESVNNAVDSAEKLLELGVHKQVVNRLLEPYLPAYTVVTSTEWNNFFRLRMEDDTQPEMQALAKAIHEAMHKSTMVKRKFHLPYLKPSELAQCTNEKEFIEVWAPVSAARCARVSYLNHDTSYPSVEGDLNLFNKLSTAGHYSPMEHQAIASLVRNQKSNNFTGWIQFRELEQ